MPGTVTTFYSYKGGVGRSFALASIGVVLAEWGYRVLVVDWDIEAPGLQVYFSEYVGALKAGVLDFLEDCVQASLKSWDSYVADVNLPTAKGRLALMPASGSEIDYTGRVQKINWDSLYDKFELGLRLEEFRSSWIQEFDFILLDSRTGLTDFSGITTVQLPDALVFLFTANNQSLTGCCDIVRRARAARRRLPIERPPILPLPIPARFEQREEYDRAQLWRSRFSVELREFFDIWVPVNTDALRLIDLLTVPYVPRWTFGEDLAALLEPAGSAGVRTTGHAASYALETIAAVLANRFSKIDLLEASRDEYVLAARALGLQVASERERQAKGAQRRANIFISAGIDAESRRVVMALRTTLSNQGYETFSLPDDRMTGDKFAVEAQRGLEKADALIVVVAEKLTSWQSSDVDRFLRYSLRTDQHKPIIPLVLPSGGKALINSRLSSYQFIAVGDPLLSLDMELQPVLENLGLLVQGVL